MNTNTIIGVIVALVVLVGGYFIFSQPAKQAETGPIKIGVTVPLTGEAASYGESGKAGIELAVKEINDAGGVNGRMLEVIFEDDKCNPSGINAMQKLVSVDKVAAVLGPVCSAVAGGAVPIARAANVPTIMIGASAPGLAGGSDSIFSDYASDAYQGKFAAEYLYHTVGKKKVALLYVKNDWGEGLQQVFTKRFTELGGTVVLSEGAAQDSKDVKTAAAKIKELKPDAVYMPAYPALAAVAVKQMKDVGVTAPIYGGDALLAEEFLRVPAAEGVTFFTGQVGNSDAFKAKVKAASGVEPNIIAPLGYDAVKILAKVMTENGTNANAIIKGLNALTYTGGESSGTISFDDNGDLENVGYDVNVVKGGKAVPQK
jgi:branched-chain amino acid transport system substrate-binding protein